MMSTDTTTRTKWIWAGVVVALVVIVYIIIRQGGEEIQYEAVEDQVITESDVQADWNTYQNEEYGFELRYPRGWREKGTTAYDTWNDLVFEIQGPGAASVQGLRLEKTSIDGYIAAEERRLEEYERFLKESVKSGKGVGVHSFIGDLPQEVLFAGRQAVRQDNLSALGFSGSVLAFPNEGLVFHVNTYGLKPGERDIPNTIIETVQFFDGE